MAWASLASKARVAKKVWKPIENVVIVAIGFESELLDV
jgi:hypothetical protein